MDSNKHDNATEFVARSYDCYSNVIDGLTKRRNLQIISDAVYRLNNYREFLAGARKCHREGKDDRFLHKHLAQRAYGAEADLRSVLKIGIDTLNVVRDFGKLDESILQVVGKGEQSLLLTNKNIDDTFTEARRIVGMYYSPVDCSFVDSVSAEAKDLFSKHTVEFNRVGEKLKMTFNTTDNKSRSMIIDPIQTPGHLTRVSTTDFCNTKGSTMAASLSPLPLPADCHHATQVLSKFHKENAFDVYGSILGNFALSRETIYSHARKVDEMGIGYFTGNLGLLIALIVVVVVIIVIVVIYYTTGNNVSLVCSVDQAGQTTCKDVDVSQSNLTSSYSATLVGMAIGLAGITCAALDNGCTLQTCPVIGIQA